MERLGSHFGENKPRIVENIPSLDQFSLQVANRHITSEAISHRIALPFPLESEIQEEVGNSLTERIRVGLEAGKIVVFNDGRANQVTGLELSGARLRGCAVARFIRGEAARTTFDFDAGAMMHGEFEDTGAFVLTIGDEDTDTTQIILPGTMRPGEQSSIVMAGLVSSVEEFGPVHRDETIEDSFYNLEKQEEEQHGNTKKVTLHYRKMIAKTRIKLEDDGFIMRSVALGAREVLAVNGLQDAGHSYLHPSGWYLAGEDSR